MATVHIPELTCDPGSNNNFAIANTWVIDSYTPFEWNGITSDLVNFYSDTPGSQATIDISAIGDIHVSYISFKDIKFIGGTVYADSTCINVSDNSGIDFNDIGIEDFPATFTVTENLTLNLYASPQSGKVPLTVVFNGTSNNTITSWNWVINGLIQPETTQQITRTFTQMGSYVIGLTVVDIYSQIQTQYIVVTATNTISILDSAIEIYDSDRIMGLVGSADLVHDRRGLGIKTPSYSQNFQNAGFTHPNGPSIIFS